MDILNLVFALVMVLVPSCMLAHATLKGDITAKTIMSGLYGNAVAGTIYKNMRLVSYKQSMITNAVTAVVIAVCYATLLPTFSVVELALLLVSTSALIYVGITKKALEAVNVIVIVNSVGWFGPILRALA